MANLQEERASYPAERIMTRRGRVGGRIARNAVLREGVPDFRRGESSQA
jgi:hypothetical protein